MFNEGNQIHNFMSSSVSGTVINYGSGSTSQKVTVPTVPVPVPVPQHWLKNTGFRHPIKEQPSNQTAQPRGTRKSSSRYLRGRAEILSNHICGQHQDLSVLNSKAIPVITCSINRYGTVYYGTQRHFDFEIKQTRHVRVQEVSALL